MQSKGGTAIVVGRKVGPTSICQWKTLVVNIYVYQMVELLTGMDVS